MKGQIMRFLVPAVLLLALLPSGPAGSPPDAALASGARATANVWVVTNTLDESGPCLVDECTLRQAIEAANSTPGQDTITFDIPITDTNYDETTGRWTMLLESPLPPNTDPSGLEIDATTLGVSGCASYFVIDASGVSYGREITGTNETLRGLVIENAQSHGVYIHGSGAQNNSIKCSYVISNTGDGVHISGASGNAIGSTGDGGNFIAGNGGDGIEIANSASNNTVVSNTIGISTTPTVAWPNSGCGVRISSGAMTNTIGMPGAGNVIGGNTERGVLISDSQGNVVQYNRIGTDPTGTGAVANQDGVVISNGPYNTVGPSNLISGNKMDGVRIESGGAFGNVVEGNYIGTNAAGDQRISNQRFGLVIESEAYSNTVGGDTSAQGNVISGNGYDGDYASEGGVAIRGDGHHNVLRNNIIGMTADGLAALPNGGHGIRLEGNAHDNAIGEGTLLAYANTIAWNEGDGIYVHGSNTLRNTIGRNSIHDNDGFGINNLSGGNRDLSPPTIVQYSMPRSGYATLRARTCLSCTVHVYSDDGGEGRTFEGWVPKQLLDASGYFDWKGNVLSGQAFTLVATDDDGNTSEFSASPVKLSLSIDDALPHVLVNKLPGDTDGPAISNTVDFVATIVSYDPSLRRDFNVQLSLSSTALGPPTRVFTAANHSDYTGTPVSWSSPAAGVYCVGGIDLSGWYSIGPWTQRVVFRFDVPPGVSPTTIAAFGTVTATKRTLSQEMDYAVLKLLKRAGEIIVTNRAQLYAQYDSTQVTTFLQDLYSFAQGPPFNWSPSSVIYYVDTYASTLASWHNTAVNYAAGEGGANVAAGIVDALIEDWVEDSPIAYVRISTSSFGDFDNPVDAPFLLIAGDDNIIPFYRRDDPTDVEHEHVGSAANSVLQELRQNDYFFTDDRYSDLSYVFDTIPWNEGGVELAVGRLVGSQARHLSTFLRAGQYGPNNKVTARAIVSSGCGTDSGKIAGYLTGIGYDVRNDTESPPTIDNDSWQESHLLGLMESLDYQVFHHGNHATEWGWCTPPCAGLPEVDPDEIISPTIASRIRANRPVFTSSGCRAGLSYAEAATYFNHELAMVNALAREGASAVMASTGISFFDSGYDDYRSGEEFAKDFWWYAARNPSAGTLSMGAALRWNKRFWDGHWSVDDEEEKTSGEFVFYGVPWVTVLYRGGGTTSPGSLRAAAGATLSPPQHLGDHNYVVTATFDASAYTITHPDGFDLVEVEGMGLAHDYDVPLVPLAEVELNLPLGGWLMDVEAIMTDTLDLGVLNIPRQVPGIPIPGGDPGGLAEAPDIGVYPPQSAVSRTVLMDGYKLARVYASPLSHDTTTGETLLHRDLALRITYHLSSTVALLGMVVDPTDLAPEEPFTTTLTLVNPSDAPVPVTGTLRLENGLGEIVAVQGFAPPEIPPGGEPYQGSLGWTAPITEGAYSLLLEIYYDGDLQAVGHQMLSVSGGRITELAVPEDALAGEEVTFGVIFANKGDTSFEGQATVSIYTAAGALMTTLDAPVSVDAGGETTVELAWHTGGAPPGPYMAAARVTALSGSATYGVIQEGFDLRNAVFLPLALKS